MSVPALDARLESQRSEILSNFRKIEPFARPSHLTIVGLEEVYGSPTHCQDARANTRVSWKGRVRVLEEHSGVDLEGLEIGRTAVVVKGGWCVPKGRAVTVEIYFGELAVQFLTTVAAAAYVGGNVVLRLDIEASSPRGNDLLAAAVRNAFNDVATAPELAA